MISQSQQSRQNFKIYKTILELLQARSYMVPDQKRDLTFEQFQVNEKQRNYERQLFSMLDQNQEGKQTTIAIFYNFKKQKITQDYIQKMIKSADKYVKNFFVVTATKNNVMLIDKGAQTIVNQLMRTSQSDPIRIELFKDQDLMFNILRHDLVPTHQLLHEWEKQQLLKKYKVKDTQLPKILLSDPVARFLGLKRGQVVKITRKSETAGTYTTYRIAI